MADIGRATSEDNANRWQVYSSETVPTRNAKYWLRVSIKNASPERERLILGTSLFDYISFYLPDSSGQFDVQHSGNLYPNHKKRINSGSFSYGDFYLEAGATATCYMYVQNEEDKFFQFLHLSPSVYSEAEFNKLADTRNLFNLLFIGAVFIMAIYNLFLFFIVKEVSYIIYVGYNLSIMSYAYALSGSLVENFADNVNYQDHLILYTGISAMICYVLFSQRILLTKAKMPKVHLFLNVCVGLLGSSFVLTAFDILRLSVPICFTVALVGYTSILLVAIGSARSGYLPAKYFLIANVFYYTGVVVGILQMLGFAPSHMFGLTSSANAEIGVVLELAFFSLSLGAKINLMRDEIARKQIEQEKLKREEEQRRNEFMEQQNKVLERKVAERTIELVERNEEINQQNEELAQQAELLSKANDELDKRNRDIVASINYAKRIQQAMMPSKERFDDVFAEYFLFFRPRDIVSGDFYWMTRKGSKIYVAAADCTGHGVPGALMSMIGNERLNHSVNHLGLDSPELILHDLNIGVREVLKQKETNTNDGMDIAFCVIDMAQKTLSYAGAMNPLVYVQDGELHFIHGTRSPIGGQQREDDRIFEKHQISFETPTTFYIYTDGYQDQFGGEHDQKFMAKRFRELLFRIHHLPIAEQRDVLESTFLKWKGGHKQLDDILVFGVKLS